jgi:hypothetical protein
MDIVNTSGISTAIASIKQFNEMAVTTAKEQLSVLLGKYFKRGSIVYFVRGINMHTLKLLIEYSENYEFRGRLGYRETFKEVSIPEFISMDGMKESSPTEYLVAKRLFIQRIDTYYNMDCLEFDIKNFFSSHNISDYILI